MVRVTDEDKMNIIDVRIRKRSYYVTLDRRER